MAANNLLVHFTEARRLVGEIRQIAEDYLRERDTMRTNTQAMQNWQGDDNTAYVENVEKKMAYLSAYAQELYAIADLLDSQIDEKQASVEYQAQIVDNIDGNNGVGAGIAMVSAGAVATTSGINTTPNVSPNIGNNEADVSKYYDSNGEYKSPVFSPGATEAGKEACALTTNNQTYQIVDQVTGPGQISQKEYERLVSVVCQASGSTNPQEMLGIVSVALNRYENGSYGSTIMDTLTAPNQFENGIKYRAGGEFYNTSWGQEKIAAAQMIVNDALNGTRNLSSNFHWYAAKNGVTRFRDEY